MSCQREIRRRQVERITNRLLSLLLFSFLCEIIFYIDFCLYSHPHLAYILPGVGTHHSNYSCTTFLLHLYFILLLFTTPCYFLHSFLFSSNFTYSLLLFPFLNCSLLIFTALYSSLLLFNCFFLNKLLFSTLCYFFCTFKYSFLFFTPLFYY